MWSHYAYGHQGICLQFLGTKTIPFFGKAQPVEYSREYPKVNLFGDSPESQVKSFLLTKAANWRYEEEWRIIDYENGPGEKGFPEELLVGVILGARIPTEDKDYVLHLIKCRRFPVKIYQASVNVGTYSLNIELLSDK